MIIPITVDITDKDLEELLESSEENIRLLSGQQSRLLAMWCASATDSHMTCCEFLKGPNTRHKMHTVSRIAYREGRDGGRWK